MSKLKDLEALSKRLLKVDHSRSQLILERDELIRDLLRENEAGPTVVARAALISTAMVYKIRDKEVA